MRYTKKKKQLRLNKLRLSKKMRGGQRLNNYNSTVVLQEPPMTKQSKNYTLRLRNDNTSKTENPMSKHSDRIEKNNEGSIEELKEQLVSMQNNIMDGIESNFDYVTMMKYDHFVSRIMSRIFPPEKRQTGGNDCNGELLLADKNTNAKEDFKLMSALKNFVEIKHDFKSSSSGKDYTLNHETSILNALVAFMEYKKRTEKKLSTTYKNLHSTMMSDYFTASEKEKEELYMKKMFEVMDQSCQIINKLNLTKYISDTKEFGKRYIEDKLKENKSNFIVQTNEDGEQKMYYLSTINNLPVEPVYSEDQTKFAFADNSITDTVMFPHVHPVERKNGGVGELGEDFKSFKLNMKNGKINTIPSFMDPANTSTQFNQGSYITDMDKIGIIRRRIQELQNLQDPYSLPFLILLKNTLDDFFSYYGSLLQIRPIDMNNQQMQDFYDECISYLSTGVKKMDIYTPEILKQIKDTFPIRLGNGSDSGYVFFDVIGLQLANGQLYSNTLKLYVADTTIDSISDFLNNVNFFPKDVKSIGTLTIESMENMIGYFNERQMRIYSLTSDIYNNIPDKKAILESIREKNSGINAEIQFFMAITVSLKAFGDASQVNYSRRVNDFLKNESRIKFPLGIGIRTTDKNVFAESIFHNNPVWFMNNGIKPHVNWISNHVGNDSIDFENQKVFISNIEKGDEKMYYSEIIKNLNRYKLYDSNSLNNIKGGGLFNTETPQPPKRRKLSEKSSEPFSFPPTPEKSIRFTPPTPPTPSKPLKLSSTSNQQPSPLDLSTPEIQNLQQQQPETSMDIDDDIIYEKPNFEMDMENFMELKLLLKNVYKTRLLNENVIDKMFNTIDVSKEVLRDKLYEINVFTSIMNDYMKNVEFLKGNRTKLQSLIENYNKQTIDIVQKMIKISNTAGGFKSDQKKLLKLIEEINKIQEYTQINKIYSVLKRWVQQHLNNNCIQKINQTITQFNTIVNDFITKIPESFQQEVQGRTSGRTQRKTYIDEESSSNSILKTWRMQNKSNIEHFQTYIYQPYKEMMKNPNNIDQSVHNYHTKYGKLGQSTPFMKFTDIIEQIYYLFMNKNDGLQFYEDFIDSQVDMEVLQHIASNTKKIDELLTQLQKYPFLSNTDWNKYINREKNTDLKLFQNFLYRPYQDKKGNERFKKAFDIYAKIYKTSSPQLKEDEIIIENVEDIQQMIANKKGTLVFIDTVNNVDSSDSSDSANSKMEIDDSNVSDEYIESQSTPLEQKMVLIVKKNDVDAILRRQGIESSNIIPVKPITRNYAATNPRALRSQNRSENTTTLESSKKRKRGGRRTRKNKNKKKHKAKENGVPQKLKLNVKIQKRKFSKKKSNH